MILEKQAKVENLLAYKIVGNKKNWKNVLGRIKSFSSSILNSDQYILLIKLLSREFFVENPDLESREFVESDSSNNIVKNYYLFFAVFGDNSYSNDLYVEEVPVDVEEFNEIESRDLDYVVVNSDSFVSLISNFKSESFYLSFRKEDSNFIVIQDLLENIQVDLQEIEDFQGEFKNNLLESSLNSKEFLFVREYIFEECFLNSIDFCDTDYNSIAKNSILLDIPKDQPFINIVGTDGKALIYNKLKIGCDFIENLGEDIKIKLANNKVVIVREHLEPFENLGFVRDNFFGILISRSHLEKFYQSFKESDFISFSLFTYKNSAFISLKNIAADLERKKMLSNYIFPIFIEKFPDYKTLFKELIEKRINIDVYSIPKDDIEKTTKFVDSLKSNFQNHIKFNLKRGGLELISKFSNGKYYEILTKVNYDLENKKEFVLNTSLLKKIFSSMQSESFSMKIGESLEPVIIIEENPKNVIERSFIIAPMSLDNSY